MTGFHESGGDSAQHEHDGHGHCHLGSENDSHGQLQRARLVKSVLKLCGILVSVSQG